MSEQASRSDDPETLIGLAREHAGGGYCGDCGEDEPCLPIRLAAALERRGLELDEWKACARGEHDVCWADGGYCCTCGTKGGQS